MQSTTFTVDAALLRELGERLIGRPYIALAELVKNSYDADATDCRIEFGDDSITVSDNGHGMSETSPVTSRPPPSRTNRPAPPSLSPPPVSHAPLTRTGPPRTDLDRPATQRPPPRNRPTTPTPFPASAPTPRNP